MKWHGLNTNTTPVDDTPYVMQGFTNGLLQTIGEVRRRRGYARSNLAQLSAAWANFSGFSEYQGQVFAMTAYADKLEGFINPAALWSDSQQTILGGYFVNLGGGYSFTITRNGNQYSNGAIIVAKPGRCPNGFQDGTLAVQIPLPPGLQKINNLAWSPPTQGDWHFSVIPTLNGIQGPANCMTSIPNYFVFAGGATGSTIFYSQDGGLTFPTTSAASGHPANVITAMTFNPVTLNWLYSMTGGYTAKSPTGVTWTATTLTALEAQAYLALADGTVIALMNEANPRTYTTNDDGTTWFLTGSANPSPLAWATDGANLAYVSSNGNIYKSTNKGASYTLMTNLGGGSPSTVDGLAYGNGIWVATGSVRPGGFPSTGTIWTSTDLITWTSQAIPTLYQRIWCVGYGNGAWVFGAFNNTGAYALAATQDFITYTTDTNPFSGQSPFAIVFTFNRFAIASSNNSVSTVLTTSGQGAYTPITTSARLATKTGSMAGYGAWAGMGF